MGCQGMCRRLQERGVPLCWERFRMGEFEGRARGFGGATGRIRGFFATLRMTLQERCLRRAAFRVTASCVLVLAAVTSGCGRSKPEPGTIVVVLENSPNNLDLRQGTDASSEQVGALIFDALVKKDEHFNLRPWLATGWEQPDPLTWVFHLRDGVRFQDGRPLEAADVVWTIESLIDSKVAGLITAKSGAFAHVDRAEARDRLTVVVHM